MKEGLIDEMIGKRSGILTVVSYTGICDKRGNKWNCRCDCGNEIQAYTAQINQRSRKSCGCRHANFKDITGEKHNHLTAVERVGKTKNGDALWKCICDCGNEKITSIGRLRYGTVKSCGCMADVNKGTHKMSKTPEYRSWAHMKDRCYNENDKFYPEYGGRGIKVCDEWINSFESFYEHMGDRPLGFSIDRIDVNGDYEPGNCRWSDWNGQARNRRGRKNTESKYKGVTVARNKFRACITKDYERFHIGYYDNEDDAGRAYNEKAKELFGEFANLNIID